MSFRGDCEHSGLARFVEWLCSFPGSGLCHRSLWGAGAELLCRAHSWGREIIHIFGWSLFCAIQEVSAYPPTGNFLEIKHSLSARNSIKSGSVEIQKVNVSERNKVIFHSHDTSEIIPILPLISQAVFGTLKFSFFIYENLGAAEGGNSARQGKWEAAINYVGNKKFNIAKHLSVFPRCVLEKKKCGFCVEMCQKRVVAFSRISLHTQENSLRSFTWKISEFPKNAPKKGRNFNIKMNIKMSRTGKSFVQYSGGCKKNHSVSSDQARIYLYTYYIYIYIVYCILYIL